MSNLVDQLRNPRLVGSASLMEDAADRIEYLEATEANELARLRSLLREARQYVNDAGSDEDGETQRLSNHLLAAIDAALSFAVVGTVKHP